MKCNFVLLATVFLHIHSVRSRPVQIVLKPLVNIIESGRTVIDSQISVMTSQLSVLSFYAHQSSYNPKTEIVKLLPFLRNLKQLFNTMFTDMERAINVVKRDIQHPLSNTDSAMLMPLSELNPYVLQISSATNYAAIVQKGLAKLTEIISSDVIPADRKQAGSKNALLAQSVRKQFIQNLDTTINAVLQIGQGLHTAAIQSLSAAAGSLYITPISTFAKQFADDILLIGQSMQKFRNKIKYTPAANGEDNIKIAAIMQEFNNQCIPALKNGLKSIEKSLNTIADLAAIL